MATITIIDKDDDARPMEKHGAQRIRVELLLDNNGVGCFNHCRTFPTLMAASNLCQHDISDQTS